MPTKPIFGPDDIRYIVALYREGKSLADIARIMGCNSRSTIKRYLLNEEVELRPRGSPRRPDGRGRNYHDEETDQVDLIRYLYWVQEYSTAEVGERLGIGQSAVVRRMQRHNVPRRPSSAGNKGRALSEERREQLRQQALRQWRDGKLGRSRERSEDADDGDCPQQEAGSSVRERLQAADE